MIGLGKSIAHTANSMGYGWNEEKEAKVVYRNHLTGENPKEITQEFKIIQTQNHQCKKNTLSFVLSPTIEDGQVLNYGRLREITKLFIREMKLQERQAIAFVHRDKDHQHIHLYVNRIGFDGKAYKDNYIGKRSQVAAEKVAKELALTTVSEAVQEKLQSIQELRANIKAIHERVISEAKPKDFDEYIKYMKHMDVQVVPSINKSNQLQGFRFKYKGHDLKGSEIHRSMSIGGIADKLTFDKQVLTRTRENQSIELFGNMVQLPSNLANKIAAKLIRRTVEKGMGIGI